MDQSSCLASHSRQKPKRGEDVFNAKIAQITDGKWKKGLSVTVTWTRRYYSTTQNIKNSHVSHPTCPSYGYCCENMAQSCCLKYHKVHIDQASIWPATYEEIALLLPEPHQMRYEWKWVWNVTIAWPRAHYNPEYQPLSHITLYLYVT